MSREIDLDEIIDEVTNKSPEYRLWLTVTLDAVTSYKNRRSSLAESFLFDPENQFFEYVADQMGYESDGLRDKIKKTGRPCAGGNV